MNPEDELSEIVDITGRSQKLIENHLSKFEDVEFFLKIANKEVHFYFNKQGDFKTIDDFKVHLTERINFYVHWFSLPFKERRKMKRDIRLIEQTYDKLLFFLEYNPVKELREKRMNESLWDVIKEFIRVMWITYKPFKS